ncbi:unnamed protein product, partial [Cylicostephanus goldi]
HVTARWEGVPLNSQSALIDADDGATVITDTIKDDQERQEPKSCPQQTVKMYDVNDAKRPESIPDVQVPRQFPYIAPTKDRHDFALYTPCTGRGRGSFLHNED